MFDKSCVSNVFFISMVFHFMLLFSILILFFGLGIFSFNIRSYIQNPSELKRNYLLFFGAFSYQLILATITLYVFVNIGMKDNDYIILAILSILGMAFLEYAFFSYHKCRYLLAIRKGVKVLLYIGIVFTGCQSFIVLLIRKDEYFWIPILLAFIPFIILVIALSVIQLKVKSNTKFFLYRDSRLYLILMAITVIIAFFEIRYLVTHELSNIYFILSLPLAYLITSIKSVTNLRKMTQPSSQLSEEVIFEYNLTKREVEIVNLVISSKSNKEIAYELKISENTVRNHIYKAYQKMGIQKRMDLVSLLGK